MKWKQQPPTGDVAKALRRGIRAFRREKGRSGHRFRYDDVRDMWSCDSEHILVTHNEDKLWQYWRNDPDKGWLLESWHRSRKEAEAEAEKSREKPEPEQSAPVPGVYVCASWREDMDYHGHAPMMIRCESDYTVSMIAEVFQRLGCATETREIAATETRQIAS